MRLKEENDAANADKAQSVIALSKCKDTRSGLEDGFKSLISKTSDLAAKSKNLQASLDKSIESKSKAERQNKDLIA